jgi:hypothetical protein
MSVHIAMGSIIRPADPIGDADSELSASAQSNVMRIYRGFYSSGGGTSASRNSHMLGGLLNILST